MTDQPQRQQPEPENSVANVSGGVNIEANRDVNTGGDAVGRDKIVHIEHYHEGGEAVPNKPKVYHNLPQPDYTRFVGRAEELAWLRERLSPEDQAWQIAITGIGGVGKSALAQATAHFYFKQYDELPVDERFEAIVWVSAKEEVLTAEGREDASLPGTILRTLEDIYIAIAQTMEREDITLATAHNQFDLVLKALRKNRTLLVIDNFESVNDRRVKAFLRNLPTPTKALITSREWLDVVNTLELKRLPDNEAGKLIVGEVAGWHLALKGPQQQMLHDLTSGLPLAIRLSIARLASGERFEAVVHWLNDATGDVPEYCVQGQVDLANRRDPNTLPLLLACSLFDRTAGGSRDALRQITNLSVLDCDESLARLQRLFLLNRNDDDRFWELPITQRYAHAQFAKVDSDQLVERWIAWLLNFAATYGLDLELHVEQAHLLAPEYPNARSAISWCYEHQRWETLLQLAECIWYFPFLTCLYIDLQEILDAAVESAKILGAKQEEGRWECRLGRLDWVRGQGDDVVVPHLDRAEEMARQFHDMAELGRVLHFRSALLRRQGKLPEAIQLAQAMFEIGKQIQDVELKVFAAHRLSAFACEQKRFEEALCLLADAEEWAREGHWSRGLAWTLYHRGNTLIQQEAFEDAEPSLVQSLEMAISWGERRLIAYNKHCLAKVYCAANRTGMASRAAAEAQDLFERLGIDQSS